MRASVAALLWAACGDPGEFCPGAGPALPPSCAGEATIDLSGPLPVFGVEDERVVPNRLAVYRVDACDPEIEEGPYLQLIKLWKVGQLGEALKEGLAYGAEVKGAQVDTEPRELTPGAHYKLELELAAEGKIFTSSTWERWFDLEGQVATVAPASCPPGWQP